MALWSTRELPCQTPQETDELWTNKKHGTFTMSRDLFPSTKIQAQKTKKDCNWDVSLEVNQHLKDGGPFWMILLKKGWFGNQPIKNAGWTSRVFTTFYNQSLDFSQRNLPLFSSERSNIWEENSGSPEPSDVESFVLLWVPTGVEDVFGLITIHRIVRSTKIDLEILMFCSYHRIFQVEILSGWSKNDIWHDFVIMCS